MASFNGSLSAKKLGVKMLRKKLGKVLCNRYSILVLKSLSFNITFFKNYLTVSFLVTINCQIVLYENIIRSYLAGKKQR